MGPGAMDGRVLRPPKPSHRALHCFRPVIVRTSAEPEVEVVNGKSLDVAPPSGKNREQHRPAAHRLRLVLLRNAVGLVEGRKARISVEERDASSSCTAHKQRVSVLMTKLLFATTQFLCTPAAHLLRGARA